jgi:hypothetical protein
MATDHWPARTALFDAWLKARVILDPNERVGATVLFNDYLAWSRIYDQRLVMTQKMFGMTLQARGVWLSGKQGDGRKLRRGARLRIGQTPEPRRKPEI